MKSACMYTRCKKRIKFFFIKKSENVRLFLSLSLSFFLSLCTRILFLFTDSFFCLYVPYICCLVHNACNIIIIITRELHILTRTHAQTGFYRVIVLNEYACIILIGVPRFIIILPVPWLMRQLLTTGDRLDSIAARK